MEKVNEVGRFKQRGITGIESFNDWLELDLNLDILHSYRFDYVINKVDLPIFLDYVDYLSIPELGIKDCKNKVIRYRKEFWHIFLTVSGKKEDVDKVDIILNHLNTGLKRTV
jgi:hypothetical protein